MVRKVYKLLNLATNELKESIMTRSTTDPETKLTESMPGCLSRQQAAQLLRPRAETYSEMIARLKDRIAGDPYPDDGESPSISLDHLFKPPARESRPASQEILEQPLTGLVPAALSAAGAILIAGLVVRRRLHQAA
jgi:hypothetical protein